MKLELTEYKHIPDNLCDGIYFLDKNREVIDLRQSRRLEKCEPLKVD
jgi:hypothetical protein